MYDAWAAYDDRAVGTQLGGALRRPASERTLANKERAISYAAYRALLTYTFVQSSVAAFTAKDDNPNLVLQMQSDFSPDLVYGLLAGKLDLALAANPSPNPKITMVKMCPYPGPGDWVFASPAMKGKQPYWPGTQWRYYGKPALKRAKITKHVTYHTFRHTFGTLLNANGENPKVVQELLRHASMKVTTDVYMQAVSPQKREAQSKLVKMVMKTASA